jgi:hypothetical protein
MPTGSDLALDELDATALLLNTRPGARPAYERRLSFISARRVAATPVNTLSF